MLQFTVRYCMAMSPFITIFSLLFFAQSLAAPTKGYTIQQQLDNTQQYEQVFYASFEASVCGTLVFKGMKGDAVTVETQGDGIFGLQDFTGPFPYQSNILTISSSADESSR
jgi:hypothetical protein